MRIPAFSAAFGLLVFLAPAVHAAELTKRDTKIVCSVYLTDAGDWMRKEQAHYPERATSVDNAEGALGGFRAKIALRGFAVLDASQVAKVYDAFRVEREALEHSLEVVGFYHEKIGAWCEPIMATEEVLDLLKKQRTTYKLLLDGIERSMDEARGIFQLHHLVRKRKDLQH